MRSAIDRAKAAKPYPKAHIANNYDLRQCETLLREDMIPLQNGALFTP